MGNKVVIWWADHYIFNRDFFEKSKDPMKKEIIGMCQEEALIINRILDSFKEKVLKKINHNFSNNDIAETIISGKVPEEAFQKLLRR